jgi:hypothetical protein
MSAIVTAPGTGERLRRLQEYFRRDPTKSA